MVLRRLTVFLQNPSTGNGMVSAELGGYWTGEPGLDSSLIFALMQVSVFSEALVVLLFFFFFALLF